MKLLLNCLKKLALIQYTLLVLTSGIHASDLNPGNADLFSAITVGQRTGVSAGTLSINTAGIQSSILATVAFFNNYAITGQPVLQVNANNAFLMLTLYKAGTDTLQVAIDLSQTENGTLVFTPHSYSKIFCYKTFGGATEARFLTDFNKYITGCTADPADPLQPHLSGCKFFTIMCQ